MIIKTAKREGETPLELIGRLRKAGKIGKGVKATYAGRLDPMASGSMLILTGEDVHKKEKYLGLDKEYEVEILFGFATDSHDILGKITNYKFQIPESAKVRKTLQSFVGKFKQEYPKYSSKRIAKSKNISPKEVEIYSIDFISTRNISSRPLLLNIERRIAKVGGDFRQKEILQSWRKYLKGIHTKYAIAYFVCKCSSGTYMRSLAHNLGQNLGIPALAFSIKRTKIV